MLDVVIEWLLLLLIPVSSDMRWNAISAIKFPRSEISPHAGDVLYEITIPRDARYAPAMVT